MKKLLSILLALVMVFSLTVPAFAAGLTPEESIGIIGGADGPTAIMISGSIPSDFWDDWEQEQEQAKNDFITEHGGVPGQINVMLDGKYVQFSDAVPEISDGRTMVPFRAIFETLGAEITFEDGKIHAALGDTALDLTIGSDTMTKTVDGEAQTVQMDCAPCIKGGRTYVPVRFISEALGYDVQWDEDFRSVVITDLDALAEQIDKNFTVYNKMAARSALSDKTQRSVGSGRAEVTLFDTLNGDKTGKGTCSYDLSASTAGASGKVEYDLSELWALIEGYIPVPLDLDSSEEYTQTLALVKALMKGSMEVRMDLEKGKAYVSMPSLIEAMGDFMEESGVQLPKNAWFSASLSDGVDPDLTAMLRQPLTMGKLLAAIGGAGGYEVNRYDATLEMAELFAKFYGDAKFTRKGSAYVLTLTKKDISGILEDLVGQDGYTGQDLDALSKFDLTLTVHDNGDLDENYQARVALAGSGLDLGDFMDVSAKATTRNGKTESTMEVHFKNVLKATITLQETVTETNTPPTVTPPSDALVLPVDGELPGTVPQP